MQYFSVSPFGLVASLIRNRRLIISMIKREVIGRYRGSAMGILWSLFNPLLMLAVYTFVFSVVFQARWNTESNSKTEFALLLFAGLIVYSLFAECANRAPKLIIENVNYVKKVVFPLEVLPVVALGATLFHTGVSVFVWLGAYVLFFGAPHASILLFPLVILPLLLFTMGVSWLFASLGVYLRDVSQVMSIITTILLFLSPIFYPATAIPTEFRPILLFNPLAPTIEQAREVLFFGQVPAWAPWAVSLIIASLFAALGFAWFQKTRKGFADVL